MQRLIQVLQLCLQVVGLTYFTPLLGSPTFFLPLFTQVRGRKILGTWGTTSPPYSHRLTTAQVEGAAGLACF
jgi:hypothetical protein